MPSFPFKGNHRERKEKSSAKHTIFSSRFQFLISIFIRFLTSSRISLMAVD